MKYCRSRRKDKTELRKLRGRSIGISKTLYILGKRRKKVSTLENNKGFINLRFLQKTNCQKTEWDQARFSSLVQRSGLKSAEAPMDNF